MAFLFYSNNTTGLVYIITTNYCQIGWLVIDYIWITMSPSTKVFFKTCISFSLLFFYSNSWAQPDPIGAFNKHIVENWGGDYTRIGPYHVKGSPYFLGQSFLGVAEYRGGKKDSRSKILYNLYNQKAGIEVNKELFETDSLLEKFELLLPETLGDKSLHFKNGMYYGLPKTNGYFNVLVEGDKVSFLKQYKTRLIADPTNTLSRDDKVFEQYFEYYVYNNASKVLHKIKLRQKDILKELADDPMAKNYIVKNDIDVSKEGDAIQLINKYNNSFK